MYSGLLHWKIVDFLLWDIFFEKKSLSWAAKDEDGKCVCLSNAVKF